jgi:type IV pilus assembly protein PilB
MDTGIIDQKGYSIISSVDSLLSQAVTGRASDIHLEQTEHYLRVRFRVDGVLIDQSPFGLSMSEQIIARLKVMASLDSAERRRPQDGKFLMHCDEKQVDMRVSTFPSLFGEKMVIRILDRTMNMIELEHIGFSEEMLAQCKQLLSQESGFILVTGPTGSGKTTTLYAALSFLNQPAKNIVTLEDPIEYALENVTQAQINQAIGFTFACGIRSVLRQDPDILMVGEIRDTETARTAIQAALTGHLVLSTIHTNDAPSVIIRLIDMGIEPFLISASLTGIISQRLLRMLCKQCCYQDIVRAPERCLTEKYQQTLQSVFRPKGCDRCNNTGYFGRTAVFELLVLSPEIRQLIVHNPHPSILYDQAYKDGMKVLFADIFKKIQNGAISFEELFASGIVTAL